MISITRYMRNHWHVSLNGRTNIAEGQANLNLMVNAKKMAQELINHRETK